MAAVGPAFPAYRYRQEELLAAARQLWGGRMSGSRRLEQLFERVGVEHRSLALPIERYAGLSGFREANDAWIAAAVDLGEEALTAALAAAGLTGADLDTLYFTTVTGIAAPSIDARLMNRLGLPPHIKRVPLFGLGCVAGAAGIARCADYLACRPDEVAALVSVELCSLTLQREDLSVANLISAGLFGDGAAAVVLTGEQRGAAPGSPRVVASRSTFYPDTERVMGWDITENGFRIVLSAGVPDVVREHLAGDVDRFLADHGLGRADIDHWIAHPGGPRVLEAVEEALELPRAALAGSWATLRDHGNLSSASILLVLGEVLAEAREQSPPPGSRGLMFALGPGFCSELVLLEWSA